MSLPILFRMDLDKTLIVDGSYLSRLIYLQSFIKEVVLEIK